MRAPVALVLADRLTRLSAPSRPTDTGPLSPGKPAGVKQADIEAGGVLLVVGILGLAAGIALLASTTQGRGTPAATSNSLTYCHLHKVGAGISERGTAVPQKSPAHAIIRSRI